MDDFETHQRGLEVAARRALKIMREAADYLRAYPCNDELVAAISELESKLNNPAVKRKAT